MTAPALQLTGINKRYGAVQANRDVALRVAQQSVHAVVGENGAGKSTLMKIAYGHVRADSGDIRIKGELIRDHSVARSIAHGVGMVHQHFMLVGPLTVVENVVLGQEPCNLGIVLDLPRAARELQQLSQRFGLDVDPHARVEELSVGQQQRVEILKVLWRGCDVLILDEPTAVLTPGEVRALFDVLRTLVKDGMTIVMITHKLDEVLAIADRVTVMRRGQVVQEMDREGLSAEDIASAMVGRPVLFSVDKKPRDPGPVVLEVEGAQVLDSRGLEAVRGVSLQVREGEIVGIAGVEGNGQSELIDALVGLREMRAGEIRLGGQSVTRATVRQRYLAGLAHVPEDRHDRALVLDYSIRDNLILGLQREYRTRADFLDRARIDARASALIERFDIRPTDADHAVVGLSGGNQQKVVVARELSRTAPKLLVCAQPTRGVDIGAIEAIHQRIVEARGRGLAVLLLSAELSELRSLSDRLLVLYKGRFVASFTGEQLAQEGILDEIGLYMTGAREAQPELDAADGGEA